MNEKAHDSEEQDARLTMLAGDRGDDPGPEPAANPGSTHQR